MSIEDQLLQLGITHKPGGQFYGQHQLWKNGVHFADASAKEAVEWIERLASAGQVFSVR